MNSKKSTIVEIENDDDEEFIMQYILDYPEVITKFLNLSENLSKISSREREPKRDIWNCEYGRMLSSVTISDPNSRHGRLFRARFRMPHVLFQEFVKICQRNERNIFRMVNNSYIPIEIKLMISLRILGKGIDFDCISGIWSTGSYMLHNIL